MNDSIDGDILTQARSKRKDVRITESNRGGIQLQTISYIDVLLENDVISKAQSQLGYAFWTIRDTAFPHLSLRIGKYEYATPEDNSLIESLEPIAELAEEGMACEVYLELCRKLHHADLTAIMATCNVLERDSLPIRMIIIQAFGENALRWAFDALEKHYDNAKETALQRIMQMKNGN